EVGRAYVGTDGLEGLYGEPEGIVEEMQLRIVDCGLRIGNTGVESAIDNPQSAIRVGWGLGKFVSWVAASRAKPGGAVIVRPGEEGRFLSSQPLAVLSLDPDTYRRLRQLGLATLGQLAALPQEAVVLQFGAAGRRIWRLAAGEVVEQVMGREAPEPIVAARAGRRRPLRTALQEIQLRLKRTLLYHIIEVQPWSRLPERRYALIDFET